MILAIVVIILALLASIAKGEEYLPPPANPEFQTSTEGKKIILLWHNQETSSMPEETLSLETEHGEIIFKIERTWNNYWCGEKMCKHSREDAADNLEIIQVPEGYLPIGGWEFDLYENEMGSIEIVPYTGG